MASMVLFSIATLPEGLSGDVASSHHGYSWSLDLPEPQKPEILLEPVQVEGRSRDAWWAGEELIQIFGGMV